MSPSPFQYLRTHAAQLIANGYRVVPLAPNVKNPILLAWPQAVATPALLHEWQTKGYLTDRKNPRLVLNAGDGVGIITEYTPAVDIDVAYAPVVDHMVEWIDINIPGDSIAPGRVGRPPRTLLMFRTSEPFSKLYSAKYEDQSGREHRIEVLGKGSQFAAFAVHPKTGLPYAWHDDSPQSRTWASLPELSRANAIRIIEEFERVAQTYVSSGHWKFVTRGNHANGEALSGPLASSRVDQFLDGTLNESEVSPQQLEEIRAAFNSIPGEQFADYGEWIKLLQVLHHRFGGASEGLELADEFSQSLPDYEGYDSIEAKWATFDASRQSGVATIATLFHWAKEAQGAQEAARLADVAARELAAVTQLEGQINDFKEDWFAFEASQVATNCKTFLVHVEADEDRARYTAALTRAVKQRQFTDKPTAAQIKKSISPQKRDIQVSASDKTDSTVGRSNDRANYTRNEQGAVEPTQTNVSLFLHSEEAGKIAYDEFLGDVMIAPPTVTDFRRITDADYPRALMLMERKGFVNVPKEKIKDGFLILAEQNRRDMAIDWAQALAPKWDGVSRLPTFASTYLGIADTPYHRAVWLYCWSAMAGRVLAPGCKADMVPILMSEEGMNKSTFVEALAPLPQTYGKLDMSKSEDDVSRLMRGKLVIEWDELKGLSGRDEETVKSFVTQTSQEWVRKYHEATTVYMRRCFFIATTNPATPLPKHGKARRWLPMTLTQDIDIQAIVRDREQLWAEAFAWFKQYGVMWEQAAELAPAERDAYREEDDIGQLIEEWLDTPHAFLVDKFNRDVPFMISPVLTHLNLQGRRNLTPQRVAPSLRNLGYENKLRWLNGKRERRWVKNS